MSKTPRPFGPVRAPLRSLLATGLVVGLLGGCAVAGTGFHPGVAAEVGDESITVRTVDRIAGDYCSAILDQLAGNNQVLPQRYLRGGVAAQLTLVSAAEQLAAQYDVEPGEQYDQKVAELQGAVATLSEGEQEAVLAIESSSTYISGVVQAIGDQQLRAEGAPAPTSDEAAAAGRKVFDAWLAENDVEIDPQFGVEIKDGQVVTTDTSVSVAVGEAAKNGQAETPDDQYSRSLASSHRCG